MNFLCIAASNSRKPVEESVSYKVCKLAQELIVQQSNTRQSSVTCLSLKEFELSPCTLCGACADSGKCPQDAEFDRLFEAMKAADGFVFVVPHYSPLPAKLMILFEKLNEQVYAGWLKDTNFVSPIQGKRFVVIGHGGMTETPEVLNYYHEALVMPVARTLKSLGMVEAIDHRQHAQSTVFGLRSDDCLQTSEGKLFPDILIDESSITARIETAIRHLFPQKED